MVVASEAQKWELGSKNCAIRNNFIIPELVTLLREIKPSKVIDLGCGTGYISREAAALSPHNASWALIDSSPERLSLAKKLCTGNVDWSFAQFDILCPNIERTTAQLVIVANTLLEFPLNLENIDRIARFATKSGFVSVFLPDTLTDVQNDKSLLETFRIGSVQLDKTDQFTSIPYPFYAHRPIEVVSMFVQNGFNLVKLSRNPDGLNCFHFLFHRKNSP